MDKLSAFMDGEASRTECKQALQRLRDAECYENWHTFHLIGDVMRGNAPLPTDFTPRFRALIEQEPTMLSPRFTFRKTADYALAAAASFGAVAVVLTLVLADYSYSPQSQTVADSRSTAAQSSAMKSAASELAPVVQAVALPDPTPTASQGRLNEYLIAHQEFSPSTALQGVAPYVRTVSSPRYDSAR